MFGVIAAEEFESWYKSLPEADAERVSSAIDVLAELGAGLGPPRSSELLLWFDGVPFGPLPGQLDDVDGFLKMMAIGRPKLPGLESRSLDTWELLSWKRHSLSLFESERFRCRLTSLEPQTAAAALRGLDQARELLRRARTELVLTGKVSERIFEAINDAVDRVLLVAELEIADPGLHASGLRELRVELGERPCRVIYGIDPGKSRALLILGEALDRCYYGASVRAAERRWAEYLAGEYLTPAPAAWEAR